MLVHPPGALSLPLELVLMYLERLVEQMLFFLDVTCFQSRGHTGAWVAARIHDMPTVVVFGLVEQGLQARLHE